MRIVRALILSICTYTRINIPVKKIKAVEPQLLLMNMITMGAFTGFLWAVLYGILIKLQIPSVLTAALVTAFPYWFSRYLHLEGFADTSAEILSKKGGYGKEKHGIYGLISTSFLLILGFAAFNTFISNDKSPLLLFFLPVVSRELAVITIFMFPPIQNEEYKYYKNNIKTEYVIILSVLFIATLIIAVTVCGINGSVMVFSCFISFLAAVVSSRKNIGISGDTTGYAITVSENASVILLCIFTSIWG